MECPNKRLKAWNDLLATEVNVLSLTLWYKLIGNLSPDYHKSQKLNEIAMSL